MTIVNYLYHYQQNTQLVRNACEIKLKSEEESGIVVRLGLTGGFTCATRHVCLSRNYPKQSRFLHYDLLDTAVSWFLTNYSKWQFYDLSAWLFKRSGLKLEDVSNNTWNLDASGVLSQSSAKNTAINAHRKSGSPDFWSNCTSRQSYESKQLELEKNFCYTQLYNAMMDLLEEFTGV